MLAPDRQDDVAEALLVQRQQALAVSVLFARHAVEDRRGSRVGRSQFLRVDRIDAAILLLRRDRQSEDLLLGEIVEAALAAEAGQGETGEHGIDL